MSYTWSDDMGAASPAFPALEQATRGAIIAACAFLDGLAPGAEAPRFDGGRFLRPINQTAKDLAAAAMFGVATSSAVESQTVLTTAVIAAQVFLSAGKGASGWTAVQNVARRGAA